MAAFIYRYIPICFGDVNGSDDLVKRMFLLGLIAVISARCRNSRSERRVPQISVSHCYPTCLYSSLLSNTAMGGPSHAVFNERIRFFGEGVVSAKQPMSRGNRARGSGELELRLQPMVERPSYRFAFLLPDEIGANRDFIFGCLRTSIEHMPSCQYGNQRKRGRLFDDPPACRCHFVAISRRKDVCTDPSGAEAFSACIGCSRTGGPFCSLSFSLRCVASGGGRHFSMVHKRRTF